MEVLEFDLPFRFSGGDAVTVEQGSEEDIANCVFAACASRPGQFWDNPDFGFPDMFAFPMPLSATQIQSLIEGLEPRASVLVQVNQSLYEEAIVNANIQVG